MFKWPATRAEFWKQKIRANQRRDREALKALQRRSWRVLVVWECAVRGPGRLESSALIDSCEAFVRDESRTEAELQGGFR